MYLLVIIVETNSWLFSTFDGPGSNGLPNICTQLLLFQRVAEEHFVVWLDNLHLKSQGRAIGKLPMDNSWHNSNFKYKEPT